MGKEILQEFRLEDIGIDLTHHTQFVMRFGGPRIPEFKVYTNDRLLIDRSFSLIQNSLIIVGVGKKFNCKELSLKMVK